MGHKYDDTENNEACAIEGNSQFLDKPLYA